MPRFKPNSPVTTEKPVVEVDTRGMDAGEYQFQLVVVDERGRQSEPTIITVHIGGRDRLRPSDVLVSRPPDKPTDTKPDNKSDKPDVTKPPKSSRKGDTQ